LARANQTVTALYGFDNPGGLTTIDIGDNNALSPGEEEQGQPTLFPTGNYPMVFNASLRAQPGGGPGRADRLQRSTTYYYRLVATTTFLENPNGNPVVSTTDGPQETFTTLSSPPMALTTTTLPAGQLGKAYSATLTATGGTAPYTWSVSHGSLPFGLRLNPKTGVISGTPVFPATSRFTLTVTDSATPVRESLSEQFTLAIKVGNDQRV